MLGAVGDRYSDALRQDFNTALPLSELLEERQIVRMRCSFATAAKWRTKRVWDSRLTAWVALQYMVRVNRSCVDGGDLGRTELATSAEEGARALYRSMKRLKNLPDYLEVMPGAYSSRFGGGALAANHLQR